MRVIIYSKDATLAQGDVAVMRNPVFWRGEVEDVDSIYPCDHKNIMAAYELAGVAVYSSKPKTVKDEKEIGHKNKNS